MTKVTIQIPDALRSKLDEMGRREQRPVEEVARNLIEKAISLDQFRRLRKELRPYAQAAGFDTDEDIFRAVS